ncbi:MAG: RES family NAD+ phosphorylase [Sedimenticola sp.]
MKPIPFKCCEGRANPKGISYLYLSNGENTSMAELRPHIGENISFAQFKVSKNLKVIDCYSVQKHYSYVHCIFDPPISQEDIGCAIWSMINNAFTKPISNDDSSSDYVPTQILAELFKAEGYDEICFKSSLGKDYNYVLFDLNTADLINCTVMETEAVSYKFTECTNRYYVKNQHNE